MYLSKGRNETVTNCVPSKELKSIRAGKYLPVPPEPTGIQKLLPGTKEKYALAMMNAQQTYHAHVEVHAARERNRLEALAQLKRQYDQQVAAEQERIATQHAEIDAFQKDLQAGLPRAIVDYFTISSSRPKLPMSVKAAFTQCVKVILTCKI